MVGLCIDWLGNRYPRPLLRVSKIKADGDFKPLPRHGLVDLWSKPNPHYNRRTMEKAVGLSLKCDGNAYIYKVRDRGGRVVQLWWIPHYRILPTWPSDGSEYIDGYRVSLDSVVYHLPPEDVLHIRDGIDPRNERLGLCALKACIREVCTINEESSYSAAILRNSGVPGLVLVPATEKLNVKQEDADQMRDQIRETAGGDNRGQSIILKGMYNIEMIGFSPEQLALKEMPVVPTARVLGSLGVAPMSLGLPDPGKTYANLAEANRTSWGGIVATQELIAESLRWDMLPEFGDDPHDYTVEYDYTHIEEMQEALDAKHTRLREDYKAGIARLDEIREALGYEPGDISEEDLQRWFPGTGSPEELERQEEQQQAQLESAAATRQAALTQSGNGGENGNGNGKPASNGDGGRVPKQIESSKPNPSNNGDDKAKKAIASIVGQSKGNEDHSFGCLMITVEQGLADRIQRWSADFITDEMLYVGASDAYEDFGRETDSHVTVLYGFSGIDASEVWRAVREHKTSIYPLLGTVSKFDSDENYDVIKIEVESKNLTALHDSLVERFGVQETHANYNPHVTIAYVKKGAADHLLGAEAFEGSRFHAIDFVYSDEQSRKTPFQLEAIPVGSEKRWQY